MSQYSTTAAIDGVNTKIGRCDVATGAWGFVHYPLEPEGDGDWIGLSDLTLLPDGTFAVIERDKGWGPTTGFNAELKAVFGVDLEAAEFRAFDDPGRARQLAKAGRPVDRHQIEAEVRQRDERDSRRSESPLTWDHTYTVIDTGGLSAEGVVELIVSAVRDRERDAGAWDRECGVGARGTCASLSRRVLAGAGTRAD